MKTVSSLVLRIFDAPRSADESLQAISLLSCFGLLVSLSLIGSGLDLTHGVRRRACLRLPHCLFCASEIACVLTVPKGPGFGASRC
jgi:hypothetical protein